MMEAMSQRRNAVDLERQLGPVRTGVPLSSTKYHSNPSPDSSEVIVASPLLRLSMSIETRCRLTLTKAGVKEAKSPLYWHMVTVIGYSALVNMAPRYRVKCRMRQRLVRAALSSCRSDSVDEYDKISIKR